MVRHQVTPETEYQFLHDLYNGNQEAINIFMTMARISHAMDDLIDKDNEISDIEIAEAFFMAICVLPSIKLYRDNIDDFRSFMFMVFTDYISSVELEKGTEHERNMAFMLRDSLTGLATLICALLYGRTVAMQKAAEIRRFFHDEHLEEYKQLLPTKPVDDSADTQGDE